LKKIEGLFLDIGPMFTNRSLNIYLPKIISNIIKG